MKAFVLMPFDAEFKSLYDDLIRPALEEAGYDVSRADSFFNQQNILRDIVGGIGHADLIVADLTTLNPNVLYELGLCHGLGIPTLILAQSMDDVPFDLRAYRVQLYSTRFDQIHKLKSAITEIARKRRTSEITFGSPVADFLPRQLPALTTPAVTPASSQPHATVSPEVPEEKGVLDFIVEGFNSAEQIVAGLDEITSETNLMSEKFVSHSKTLEALAQNPGPGTPAEFHRVATTAATHMNQYADKLASLNSTLDANIESLSQNFDGWLNPAHPTTEQDQEAVIKFRGQVQELLNAIHGALSIRKFRNIVSGLTGLTREMNRASRHLVQALDGIIASMAKLESFCVRTTALLDEKLQDAPPSAT